MQFSSKQTIDSESCEGVRFTIRRLSQPMRAERDLKILKQMVRIGEIATRQQELLKPYMAPGNDVETLMAALDGLLEKYDASAPIREQLKSYWAEASGRENWRKAPDMPEVVKAEYDALDKEYGLLIITALKPATIRAALVSIDGYEIDGKKVTADMLLDNGPDSLIEEVWVAINQHSVLTAESRKNSLSPSDGPAATEGENPATTPTTASAAND